MTAFYWTVRNDMRVQQSRCSPDSAWPIRRSDGSKPSDHQRHYTPFRKSASQGNPVPLTDAEPHASGVEAVAGNHAQEITRGS